MKREREKEVLGIVGGLGPLASAEFLKTVYEYGIGEYEQDAPIVLMYSDPTFPDRTDSFLAGESELLLAKLTAALQCLSDAGASRFVICCMTIHYLLSRLPPHDGQLCCVPWESPPWSSSWWLWYCAGRASGTQRSAAVAIRVSLETLQGFGRGYVAVMRMGDLSCSSALCQ